ncbi:MAG: aminopeptidase, partial [Rickettsiales bacterium]
YLQLFFELCDQPWEAVEEAQAQLIDEFDAAKELRIQNDDGTDLVLDIEGQTFANSVIKKNVPGSEIFSSPKREGVNGTWVANGKFLADGHEEPIENMRFRFENGKVVEAHAEKNNEALQEVLGRDEGARYCGEIGIGTNPWLKQHVMNGLLVEKVGGTFHLALGACYNYETYDGKPVNVKNGNKSGIHWDITTMLKGRGGKMYLDGKLIQEDGLFLAPQYRVFNEGWAALPAKEQPGHWQKRLAEKAAEQTAQKLR